MNKTLARDIRLFAICAGLMFAGSAWGQVSYQAPQDYYPLNEIGGTTAHDAIGAYDLTTSSTPGGGGANPSWQPTGGPLDLGAIAFSSTGTASEAFYGSNSAAIVSGYPFTITCWLNSSNTTTAAYQEWIFFGDGTSSQSYTALGMPGTKLQYPCAYARNTTLYLAAGPNQIADGNWHHLAGVYASATNRILYVDGVACATNTTFVTCPNMNRIGIGGLTRSVPADPVQNGAIADIGVWNAALSAQQIALINGLGVFQRAGLNDSSISSLLAIYNAQGGTAAVGAFVWGYATGLSGTIGATGGSDLTTNADIVLDGSGNGVRQLGMTQVPYIYSFTATPDPDMFSSAVTLSWSALNATNVTINPGGGSVSATGSLIVNPTNSATIYTLTAQNTGGALSKSVKVTLNLPIISPPPGIVASRPADGGDIILSWPQNYTGWQLQMQTNPLNTGLGTNWFNIPRSTVTNQLTVSIAPTNVTAFFRLISPQPIFSNSAFAFYPDRMVCSDVYAGTYRSTDGETITEDGNPGYTWTNAQAGKLYLQTPYPILDATFSLAVDALFKVRAPGGTSSSMLSGYSPGSIYYVPYFYMTHGTDIREYTRDFSQEIQWGDIAILDPVATRGTLIRRCDFANNIIREDAVVTSDSIHFISAAWEYFKITGDTNLLATCWNCMWNTMTNKEATYLDTNDGLWYGGPWSDNSSGYATSGDFNNRLTQLKSLYCNLLVTMAWRDLGRIADTLGFANQAALCSQKSAARKTAINAELYRPEFGTYCYYVNVASNTICNYREDISAGLLCLSGVASNLACMTYHSNFLATPYGYRNVDPIMPAGETSYHGGNVWEDEEGFHGWAMSLLGQPEELEPFIFWHARAGLPLKKWQEGTISPSTGQFHSNYTWVSWGGMGYTCYWTRGVFGIIYNPDGIQFQPCVPHSFGNHFYAILNNFTYRNSNLRIILTGCGTVVQSILIDGVASDNVPATLTGSHLVQITMANAGVPNIPPSSE